MGSTRAIAIAGLTALLAACSSGVDDRRAALPPQPPLPPLGSSPVAAAPDLGLSPRPPAPNYPASPADSRGAPEQVAGGPNGAGCDATAAQGVIGRLGNVAASDEAKALAGARTVRVLYSGQPITQEFIADRLNLETNDDNNIVRVRCG